MSDNHRLLPRFTQDAIEQDPLEALIAKREAQETATREAINNGHTPQADPQDLRGIPCIARGVGGTSPGTNPAAVADRIDRRYPRWCA